MAEEKRAGKEIDEDDQEFHDLHTDLIGEEPQLPSALDLDLFHVAFREIYNPNHQEPQVNESSSLTVSASSAINVQSKKTEPSSSTFFGSAAASSSSAINVPTKKRASYAPVVSGFADSSSSTSSAIKEPSKKTEPPSSSIVSGLAVSSSPAINKPSSSSSSRNGESSGTVQINMEHTTQNPMVTVSSTVISPNARPWSRPQNTTQQRPMQTQMNITMPNYVNGMHQLNLNASTPRMYQQQNFMRPPETYQHGPYYYLPVANQGMPMMQQNFMGPPQTYHHGPYYYYLPVANQSMPMMSPSELLVFEQNYFNQQVQQHLSFPIDTRRWYYLHHQQRRRQPQTQQPPQFQRSNDGPSSHQGQDKNEQ